MTPNDTKGFAAALRSLADILNAANGEYAAQVERLASVFDASPEKTTAATLKKLAGLDVPPAHGDRKLQSLSSTLKDVQAFSQRIGAIKFASLLEALRGVMNGSPQATVEAFVAAAIAKLTAPKPSAKKAKGAASVRDDVVLKYARRLDECLGDEGFQAVYDELAKGSGVSGGEIVQIARTFTSEKPSSRPKALKAIWNRHHTLMTFRAKAESRGGRSAA